MTINPTAWILLAMYVALAEERGLDLNKLSGTVQNDILKEYIAQKEWIFPIRPSMRHRARHDRLRRASAWPATTRSTSAATTSREAGANAGAGGRLHDGQRASPTSRRSRAPGVPVDEFAPRLAFYFVAQADFFEEVAKFRAARRDLREDHEGALRRQKPESMRLRFHCQTAAATLTKAQPMNNVVRTALQALSAVLGGAQSLHTNGLDEAYAIPSEEAMKIALRTQQIIADETRRDQT